MTLSEAIKVLEQHAAFLQGDNNELIYFEVLTEALEIAINKLKEGR